MKFGGMGGFELVIILVVVLLIFGPKNLPKLGSALGKTVSNLRSGMKAGKKKDVQQAEACADESNSDNQPVAIEGEVKKVENVDEPSNLVDKKSSKKSAETGKDLKDKTPKDTAKTAEEAPKKVKRVVRKKAAEDQVVEEQK